MSLFITSLNSGSNGNCYYVGNNDEAVLIDAGISCRETETRLGRLGLAIERIKAVFISHEHKDHVSGLAVLAKKYQLPVYITEGTQRYGKVRIDKNLLYRFQADVPVRIGNLSVTAFQKMHDAGDPHSFIVNYNGVCVGVFTDLGVVCKQLIRHFKLCHAAFLESNYDTDMLMNGDYPWFLKKRITDGRGHLSNLQALELFKTYRPAFMSHLILSHLSKHNNCPDLVRSLFSSVADSTEIVIASRYEETPLLQIKMNTASMVVPLLRARRKIVYTGENQLTLF